MTSMVVQSDGSYGVPNGLMFSFPVTCRDGEYTIVKGLAISPSLKIVIEDAVSELLAERARADFVLSI